MKDLVERISLGDDQRDRVQRCLRSASIPAVSHELLAELVMLLESSVFEFRADKRDMAATEREVDDFLRGLWMLANDPDPPIAQIRARLSKAPRKALDYIDSRATHLIPRLFNGASADGGFMPWADQAASHELVEAVRALTAEGGRIVPGRGRGRGVRSGSKFEPVVRGHARGAGAKAKRGGRPKNEGQDRLVMHLALDWYRATGQMPDRGRSDGTGFGELVHSVFDWLDEPGATQALRRYWSQVPSIGSHPIAGGREYS